MEFYERLGYVATATAPYEHRPLLQPCHFILMTKPLDSGSRAGELTYLQTPLFMVAIRWQSGVDFFVLALSIYWLLKWSRQARALRLALGILALRVGALVAQQLGLVITGWVLDAVTVIALLTLIIVFQPDLRRALMQLDLTGRARHGRQTPIMSAVGAAAFALARVRAGALVVITRKDSIAEFGTPGVVLGGRVSTEILSAIFQKGIAGS